MRDTRRMVVAGGVLAASALLAWIWLALFPLGFYHEADAAEQAAAQGEPAEGTWEPDVYGAVKLVDLGHQRVTLAIGTVDGIEQENTYTLAKDADVLVNGPTILVDDVATHIRVGLVFGPDCKEAAAIRSEAFQITIEPKQHEVEIGKPFDMVLRVTNATKTSQSFWVMLTTWNMHYKSSNDRTNWDFLFSNKNFPIPVKLPSGEVYEKTLAKEVTCLDRVRFKIGYLPLADKKTDVLDQRLNPYGEVRRKLKPGEHTYWSCEVKVEVR